MSRRDTDSLARAYIAAQAVRELDRIIRGVKVCGCGKEYAPTADGRRVHQMTLEHVPSEPKEAS